VIEYSRRSRPHAAGASCAGRARQQHDPHEYLGHEEPAPPLSRAALRRDEARGCCTLLEDIERCSPCARTATSGLQILTGKVFKITIPADRRSDNNRDAYAIFARDVERPASTARYRAP
jgi:hypothetical protein